MPGISLCALQWQRASFLSLKIKRIYHDIIDPKITKNLSNRYTNQDKLKIELDIIHKSVKLVNKTVKPVIR